MIFLYQHFKPNPYFENTTLSKEFVVDSSGDSNITGSTIQWKEGKVCSKWNVPLCIHVDSFN